MPRDAQVVARGRLDDAEVLADHDGAGALRLQRQHADHRLVVVAHVGALGRRAALRDPPEPEQPDDVVDADPAGVPQHGRDQVAERRVAELLEPVRAPRRLAPVLADLVERVRRCADLDAARRTSTAAATRRRRRGARRRRGRAWCPAPCRRSTALAWACWSCSSSTHCSQDSKSTSAAVRGGERGHGRGVDVLQRRRASPGSRCRAPAAITLQVAKSRSASPCRARNAAEVELAAGAARGGVHDPQRRPLGGPGGVPVDDVGVVELVRARSAARASTGRAVGGRQLGVLGDPLDAQVERVEEPPGGGQVRRRLERRDRLGGVQRVDQQVVGAQLARRTTRRGRPGRRGRRRPRTAASGRCRAARPAPTSGGRPIRSGRPSQAGVTISVERSVRSPERAVQGVVAQRQVARHLERGLPDQRRRRPRAGPPSGRSAPARARRPPPASRRHRDRVAVR